jgi:hypothetical protein
MKTSTLNVKTHKALGRGGRARVIQVAVKPVRKSKARALPTRRKEVSK